MKIAIIGAGNMGGSIARGLAKGSLIEDSDIIVSNPSAGKLEQLKKEFPNISLGTVYRNLNFLVEHGEAIQIDCGDGFVHFDGNPIPHNHFFCRSCKSLLDIKMDSIEHIDIIANANFPGKIEGHTVIFHGLCEKCCQKAPC